MTFLFVPILPFLNGNALKPYEEGDSARKKGGGKGNISSLGQSFI